MKRPMITDFRVGVNTMIPRDGNFEIKIYRLANLISIYQITLCYYILCYAIRARYS